MSEKDEEASGKLRLASQRTEREVAAERQRNDAERAAERLACATRILAANILHTVAGAGKYNALFAQIKAVLTAFEDLQSHVCTRRNSTGAWK